MLLGCSSVNSSINGFPFFWAMFLLLVCGHIVPAYAVGVQLREQLDQQISVFFEATRSKMHATGFKFSQWKQSLGARNGRPLEPARSRNGARNGCSSPPRCRKSARYGSLSALGAAMAFETTGAFEMAARIRLGAARALQVAARTAWEPQWHSKITFEISVRRSCLCSVLF